MNKRCGNCGKYPFCNNTKGAFQIRCDKFQKKSLERKIINMDLDNEEVKITKNINNKEYKDLKQAIEIVKHRDEYLVPNSDMDWAIEVLLKFVEKEV